MAKVMTQATALEQLTNSCSEAHTAQQSAAHKLTKRAQKPQSSHDVSQHHEESVPSDGGTGSETSPGTIDSPVLPPLILVTGPTTNAFPF